MSGKHSVWLIFPSSKMDRSICCLSMVVREANWDSKHFWGDQVDFPSANTAMIAEKTSFVDYVPAQFGVYEGLLLKRI